MRILFKHLVLYFIVILVSSSLIKAQEVRVNTVFSFAGNGFYDPSQRYFHHVDHIMTLKLYDDGNFFWARNLSSSAATIVVVFDKFSGASSFERLPYVKFMPPGNQRLFNLNIAAGTGVPDIQYTFYYTNDHVNPVVEDVSYALPVNSGKKVKVERSAIYFTEPYEDGLMKLFGIKFKLAKGDSILAARGGVVEKVILSSDKDFERANRIKVRHADGTVSDYIGFDGESLAVKEGDEIFTGMPLAFAGGSEEENSSDLFFSISYLTIDVDKKFDNWCSIVFMEPIFQTRDHKGALKDEETYIGFINNELIAQEMSNRLKKEFNGAGGN